MTITANEMEMNVGGIDFKQYGQIFLYNMTCCIDCSDIDMEAEYGK